MAAAFGGREALIDRRPGRPRLPRPGAADRRAPRQGGPARAGPRLGLRSCSSSAPGGRSRRSSRRSTGCARRWATRAAGAARSRPSRPSGGHSRRAARRPRRSSRSWTSCTTSSATATSRSTSSTATGCGSATSAATTTRSRPSTARVGVIGRVIRNRRPELVSDPPNDPDFLDVAGDVTGEICAPLLVDDQLLGVVNVETLPRDPRRDRLRLGPARRPTGSPRPSRWPASVARWPSAPTCSSG